VWAKLEQLEQPNGFTKVETRLREGLESGWKEGGGLGLSFSLERNRK